MITSSVCFFIISIISFKCCPMHLEIVLIHKNQWTAGGWDGS
jgi:hypothetical protein